MTAPVLFLPSSSVHAAELGIPLADAVTADRLQAYLANVVAHVRRCLTPPGEEKRGCHIQDRPSVVRDRVLHVLTSRAFNAQSRGRVASAIPEASRNIEHRIQQRQPISLFLLYHGGYRASPFPELGPFTFAPDHTELLTLFQVARLHERISEVYPPGIVVSVVLNDRVAEQVNDVPIADLRRYAERLRWMVRVLGAEARVQVLVQSEEGHADHPNGARTLDAPDAITERDHRVVERFLGRACTPEEAAERTARYADAEIEWSRVWHTLARDRDAVVMRQVASDGMLSFRPFPGGAIRVQNGTLAFSADGGIVIPRLLTSATRRTVMLRAVTLDIDQLVSSVSPMKHPPRDG